MRYYIIAGEASGDLHASNLIAVIRQKDAHATIRAWGGDLMERQGATIVKHYRDLAFMGFAEVISNLRTIMRNLSFCKKDLLSFKPDVLILIDYPGFNLRLAAFAHKHGIKVVYYISPQIWAWKKGRVHTIKRVVDKMLVILPFEKAFYRKYDVEVDFVGHPLLDALQNYDWQDQETFRKRNGFSEKPIIAMLPGSRKQEVSRMLRMMLVMVDYFPAFEFAIAAAPSLEMSFYQQIVNDSKVKIIQNQTYDLLKHAHAALVTSGTATLETALIGTPEVVCYRGNNLSYQIARRIIDVKYISLVNLIMDREVVKELIQNDFNEQQLKTQLEQIITEGATRVNMLEDFAVLRKKLGGCGASDQAADHILDLIKRS
ncbi:MAG: lipid-A-disaccharide synthase [Bacteroidetes bacterium]|nr:lipid-A-disaccharide synthase [Bacteroidota bacterium]MBU1578001.1 lipid-A-disaccharide synthase [Bacteroidota bacterium]MBU2466443.1 lipid-A-disaccharide synthase [Bacteroidota bacterium]MBU2558096.1 lipid-A-disaccharide synthase [Bacteroidota bacterium]